MCKVSVKLCAVHATEARHWQTRRSSKDAAEPGGVLKRPRSTRRSRVTCTNTHGQAQAYNQQSMRREGGIVTVWTRTVFDQPQLLDNGKAAKYGMAKNLRGLQKRDRVVHELAHSCATA